MKHFKTFKEGANPEQGLTDKVCRHPLRMDTQKDAITPDLRKVWYCLLCHRPVDSQFTEARATLKLLLLPNLPEPVPRLFFLHAVLDTFPPL